MHLIELKRQNKLIIGTKQSSRTINDSKAKTLFVAKDCEQHVIRSIVESAKERGVQIVYVESMKKLGEACGIDVGAATAVILK